MKPICVICTEELIADSNVSVIHCGHLFHEVCLNKWLSNGQNDTCPQCRYTATPEKVIKKLFFTNLESQERVYQSLAPNFMQLNVFLEEEFLRYSGTELYDVNKVEATKQVKIRKMNSVLRVKQILYETFVSFVLILN